jgi:uncharacterized protein
MALKRQPDAEALEQFCRRHGVRRLAVFGSVLRDDFGPESDVDLLVEFGPSVVVGLMGLSRMEHELSDLFGRRVDLNTPGGLHRRFRDRVLAEAEVLYAA